MGEKTMTTNAELEQYLVDVRLDSRALTSAEDFVSGLVSAHLQNERPEEKAQAVRALWADAQPERNKAIDMYLTALNYQYLDGNYSQQDAKLMNTVVVNIVQSMINHEPQQTTLQTQYEQYQR